MFGLILIYFLTVKSFSEAENKQKKVIIMNKLLPAHSS